MRFTVTLATREIDRELANDPHLKGEEFYGDRLFVAAPFSVTFMVDSKDRKVQVLQVWRP